MFTVAYGLFALAHLMLGIWGVRLVLGRPSVAGWTLVLPIFALVYDNAVAASGSFVGEGPLLRTLTLPRFVGHAFLTPVWTVTSVGLAALFGVALAQRRGVRLASWALYGLLVALGIVDALVLLNLEPLRQADVLVYTNAGGLPGPPIPAIVMVLVTIVMGALVLRQANWPWMLAGALFMLLAAAVPASLVGFVVSAAGEVVLAAALVSSEARALRLEADSVQGEGS